MRATAVHEHCFREALLLTVLSIVVVQFASVATARSQEVDFKPRWDGIEKPKRARPPEKTPESIGDSRPAPVFSFERYAPRLREICNFLELDHRRDRLGKIAFDDVRSGSPCKSCRALLKEVVEQCQYRKKVVIRPTAAPKPAEGTAHVTPTPGSAENNAADKSGSQAPQGARYPRTDLLDATSALSAEFYERDSGQGATFESVKYFADLIERQGDLSPAERDYFGIFTSYLLSAWMGRPDSPLEASEPSKEEIRELFQAP